MKNNNQLKIALLFLFILNLVSANGFGQGHNHRFMLGYDVGLSPFAISTRAQLLSDTINFFIVPDSFSMPFASAQANISDANGNFLMASNGIYIMNTAGDTMLNGSGLNPNPGTASWASSGIPFPHSNLILPFPGDSNGYILLHQTFSITGGFPCDRLFYTRIDMTLDGGLGGVTAQKNWLFHFGDVEFGLAACRHGNGRDWWVIAQKASSDTLLVFLLNPQGINFHSQQGFGFPATDGNANAPKFSANGDRYAYTTVKPLGGSVYYHDARVFDFDRCNGVFSNAQLLIIDNAAGVGNEFSPNGRFLYVSSSQNIYQFDLNAPNVQVSKIGVALYDGFFSPYPPFATDFCLMTRRPDGKIYISTWNSTLVLHCIEFPDSLGLACDVQQHSIPLPCYAFRADVNHPNYNLGRWAGSPCDTLAWVGNEEIENDFKLRLYPNPSRGEFKLIYLLPQGESGILEIYNVEGKRVYNQVLPPWSTLQELSLSLPAGLYTCRILSKQQQQMIRWVVVD
jgi:Secretion system C-terminal sorting domain